MGVATVGLLYATVKRWSGPAAGLLAGAVLALTPVAVLMFRFNNPDALLVLLLVAGGVRDGPGGGDAAAPGGWCSPGCCVGFGFLAKMLQALLVVPAFAAGRTCSPRRPAGGRRIRAAPARRRALLVASAGWWVRDRRAVARVVAALHRRLADQQRPGADVRLQRPRPAHRRRDRQRRRRPPGGGWGETGWTRLFDAEIGGQVAWLLPAALCCSACWLWRDRRAAAHRPRCGPRSVLWGGWLLVTGLVFSFMAGHLPRLLHRRARPGDRRAGRHGRGVLWRRPGDVRPRGSRWPRRSR